MSMNAAKLILNIPTLPLSLGFGMAASEVWNL